MFGKDIYFSYKFEVTLPSKSKDDLFPKNIPKDDIYSITEKDNIHPRKDDISTQV